MGFSFSLSTLRWKEPDLEQLLESLYEHGWDGWESRQSLDWLGSAARVKDICNRTGVHVSAIMGIRIVMDTEDSIHEMNRRRIEFCSDLECDIFVAKGPYRLDHDTTDEEFDRIAEIYEDMAAFAEPLGVKVVYHPHVRHVVDSKDEWKRFMTRLDKCKLCMDMSHAVFWDYDPVQAIRDFKDEIVYVHLHDHRPDDRLSVEIGEAMMCDFPAFLNELEKIGYNGWITACPGRIERDEMEKIVRNRAYLKEIGY